MYALNALTGAVIWKTNLGTPDSARRRSTCGPHRSCSTGASTRGSRRSVTARSSRARWCRWTRRPAPSSTSPNMVPDGCIGGGIWTSPTVDPSDGSIYVTTGTPNPCHTPGTNLAPSIVKLRASDLAILSSWTVPVNRSRRSATPTSAGPRRCSPRPSTACRARSWAPSTRTVSSSPGTATTWPPARCGSRRSPIRAGARARSSRPPGTASTSTSAAVARSSTARAATGTSPRSIRRPARSCGGRAQDFMTAGLTEVPGHAHRG